MRSRSILWLVLLVTFVLLLAACTSNNNEGADLSKDGNQSSQNNSQNNNEEEEIDWDNIEADITVYGVMYQGEWQDRYEHMLTEKFPNYNFTFISATTTNDYQGLSAEEIVATGTKIDIYTARLGILQSTFMPVELHTPMNDLMEKHGIDTSAFESQYFDAVTGENGEIYALPIVNDAYVMYYNKALFDRFGLDYPTDGLTWDEAIALGEEFTRNQDGKQYVGLWYSPQHILRANQKSLGFVDPDTHEPALMTKEWNDWATKLFQEPMQDPGLQERAREQYFGHDDFRNTDVVGMYVFTTGWFRQNMFLPPDWDVAAIPTFDGDGIGAQPYADYFALASTSETPDAAMRVLKYLTSEEFQTYFSRRGFITPLKSQEVRDVLYEDVDGLDGINIPAIFYNELAPQRPLTAYDNLVIDGPLSSEAIPEIVRGNLDVNSALRKAQDAAKVAIEQEKLRQQIAK